MKQQISLAQLQGAMAQYNCTAEQVLATYDCPEYTASQVSVGTVNVATTAAAFDLMAFAAAAPVSASGSAKRCPAWEATIEDLRERVLVRDVQTPNKKDEANAKLRIQIAPQYVKLSAYGTNADGSEIVHFIVPRHLQAQAEAKLLADVKAGVHDAELKAAALRCKASSDKKAANKANKAPLDANAAQAALAALEAGMNVQVQAAPVVAVEPAVQALDLGLGGGVMPTL